MYTHNEMGINLSLIFNYNQIPSFYCYIILDYHRDSKNGVSITDIRILYIGTL